MSSAVPLLQILFCLVMQFMPAGTKQFTVAIGNNPKITFTQLDDGTWTGKNEKGVSYGTWTANGMVLTTINQNRKFDMDLNKFVNFAPGPDGKKIVTINGVVLKADSGDGTITFLQGDGGMLKQPVVVTFPAK